eukprot:TRINITY_DN1288_c0_g2_i1.p1 TRINITY_DN1288_c0_g2~~TRINITY_DN1288_c0_g2_i1.p1  ORF type:complete len:384 (-),score=101.73 TRINITY_DN1288_c0_g2_i1:130-1281(-)
MSFYKKRSIITLSQPKTFSKKKIIGKFRKGSSRKQPTQNPNSFSSQTTTQQADINSTQNTHQNMISIKVRHMGQMRRASFPTKDATYAQLVSTLSTLFTLPVESHSICYRDEEEDWIRLSSDSELKEAIRINGPDQVLHLVIRPKGRNAQAESGENAENPQTHPGWWNRANMRRGPFVHLPPNGAPGPVPVPAPERHRRGPFPLPHVRPPFCRTGRLGPFFPQPSITDHPSFNQRPLPPVDLPFHHPATCDSCYKHIVGIRHKCDECPNYDLCQDCISGKDKFHEPSHTFKSMDKSFWSDQPDVLLAPIEVLPVVEETSEGQVEVPAVEEKVEEKESEFGPQIKTLNSMGFFDEANNLALLERHGGNLTEVIVELLEQDLTHN